MDRRRNPLKDPAPFRAWLRKKGAWQVVGLPREAGRPCPLENFITESRCAEFVNIGDRFAYVVDNQYFRVPPWADLFIEKVDKCTSGITATLALTLLGEVEETLLGGS